MRQLVMEELVRTGAPEHVSCARAPVDGAVLLPAPGDAGYLGEVHPADAELLHQDVQGFHPHDGGRGGAGTSAYTCT